MSTNGSVHGASAQASSVSAPSMSGGAAARWQTYPFGCGNGPVISASVGGAERPGGAASATARTSPTTDLAVRSAQAGPGWDGSCIGFTDASGRGGAPRWDGATPHPPTPA